ILTVLAAVLLERQIVFVCPNLSVLSAVVLSLIPMIRPFSWQSVLLPILPSQLLTFLDAPVPFLVGMQYKTVELKDRASNLIRVNIPKDKVKVPTYLPRLPDEVDLYSRLEPFHSALASMPHADKRPMYRTTEDQPYHSALASMPHVDKRPMYRTTEDQVGGAEGQVGPDGRNNGQVHATEGQVGEREDLVGASKGQSLLALSHPFAPSFLFPCVGAAAMGVWVCVREGEQVAAADGFLMTLGAT
ncbi:unnamed protein product, partial [Closterium sp. NIES-53]